MLDTDNICHTVGAYKEREAKTKQLENTSVLSEIILYPTYLIYLNFVNVINVDS